jgi:hypothetical protein
MNISTGQRRFPAVTIVVLLFTCCILAVQFWVSKQFPTVAGLARLEPSFVFLEIPVQLPFTIDLLLAPALFLVVYSVITLFNLYRIKAALTGLFALLFCTLAGGVIYYFLQDHLSVPVRNAINTLGINIDIHSPYKDFQLRGSMIVFACFVIGLIIFFRKVRKAPPVRLTREQRITPYERMLREKKEVKTIHHVGESQLCYSHPVFTLRPLAVNYMPIM